ncbi:gametogenetin-like [Hippopotamus amphibius kiboko]|uniref:gametogenetin-like n=1 Tax=Hippopotamus amphibius kiboko TaxID=575201 RepID=UPI00259671BD|nr:gametogenetin-like [Hippopotamus amphibius kiboko]
MRDFSQKPGTLRGARPHSRAHAGASRGFPACAGRQSRPGACACYLRPTRVAGFPRLRAPAPRRPLPVPGRRVPFLSSRNGAGAARGRAPGTRLALGLALSATAWLAPPRALPQSVAPKAPLSSGGGGGGCCFRSFRSLQSRVASSTPPPLPLPQRGAAAAEGCSGGGDWGAAEAASAPASVIFGI